MSELGSIVIQIMLYLRGQDETATTSDRRGDLICFRERCSALERVSTSMPRTTSIQIPLGFASALAPLTSHGPCFNLVILVTVISGCSHWPSAPGLSGDASGAAKTEALRPRSNCIDESTFEYILISAIKSLSEMGKQDEEVSIQQSRRSHKGKTAYRDIYTYF